MRLDRFFVSIGVLTRTECSKAAKKGRIRVNGEVVKSSSVIINENSDEIELDGEKQIYKEFVYIMLSKPAGYISATDDRSKKTVLDLLPDNLKRMNLFPCGRLDIDTTGLLILTNDGKTAHYALSPKHHVCKEYFFECASALGERERGMFEEGVTLDDGYVTLPCKVRLTGEKSGFITVTEGKFHQIKRMFKSVNNEIVALSRVSFGGIRLDDSLPDGQWRDLSEEEEKTLLKVNPERK